MRKIFDPEKFASYLNEYSSCINNVESYLSTYQQKIFVSENSQLLHYSCTKNSNNKKVFLIIPSIFNSPEILFLNKKKSFINYLRDMGDVYLLDWQEIENPDYEFDGYVKEVSIALSLTTNTCLKVDVLGHCIGGNIALAAAIINQQYINSLTLLTTPWDFSHFFNLMEANKAFNLDANVRLLPQIPKTYIQILFFLLSPDYFNIKVDKYFTLESEKDKEFFLKIERWLMSGYSLPNKAYFQLMEYIHKNEQRNNNWTIDGIVITPEAFNKPVCIIQARDDNLVPNSSIMPLYKNLKKAKLIELPGGHISYLISNNVEKIFSSSQFIETLRPF